ncbi:MAG: beta-galactosidase [Elusimicrobia bacterium]|nr:beta-galactosidase [Elusimicrobiota bacterium]
MKKRFFVFAAVCSLSIFLLNSVLTAKGWKKGYFRIEEVNGRKIFIDPNGKPFYSIAMCYAWGPDTGVYSEEAKDAKKGINDLIIMKKHGFNTLNLYGLFNLEEVLTWCDANEFAFYPRMNYYELPDFPKTLKEFPDFMDPDFRENAKKYFDAYCPIFKKHPCVQAIDMDQRWLFPLDWSGEKHVGKVMLGSASIKYMPKWLKKKYKKIEVLNKLWRKDYKSFNDILDDKEVIRNGVIRELTEQPWRLDIYEYALWTTDDFLKELTSYIRKIDIPQRMVTYTTEMPEVCPFPLSTKESSGLDFVSPVHYNSGQDLGRDWIGLGELLYMVKWHSDLQDMLSYISETGFRTSPLKQNPPFKMYAYSRDGDEDLAAEMYLRQTALENIWPWMGGWTHFKFYDKLFEGDFGYIRDDRTLKPVSDLGQYINDKLPVNYNKEKDTQVWIYYPKYAIAAPKACFRQFKSLVMILENDFLKEFDRMIEKCSKYIKKPSEDITKTELFTKLVDVFEEKWISFKFTSEIPEDDKPIIIGGNSLELLSMEDRKKLESKKVITMVQAGVMDDRCNKTDKWFLSLLDIDYEKFRPRITHLKLDKYFNNDGIASEKNKKDGIFGNNPAYSSESLPAGEKIFDCNGADIAFMFPDTSDGKNNNIQCSGQKIEFSPESCSVIHFLAASHDSDTVGSIEIVYSDGSKEKKFMGATVTDWKYTPVFGHAAVKGKSMDKKDVFMTHIAVNCNVTKKIKTIVLPVNKKIHIFAVTLEGGTSTGMNVDVNIKAGKKSSKGTAYWMVPLEKNEVPGKVLAAFSDGKAAVAQSKDGTKTVFLYDALTWKGEDNELSKDVDFTSEILKEILFK